jgi:hypothetical protein
MDYLFFEKDDPFPDAASAEGFIMIENGFIGKAEEASEIPRLDGRTESVLKNGKAQPISRPGPELECLDKSIISKLQKPSQHFFQ